MKRLYYLTENIDSAEQLSDRLHQQGITDWNFHVLGKDKMEIVRHHLHGTTPLQELDIIRCGERGAMTGLIVGILLTCYVALFTSFAGNLHWSGQAASIVLFALFGAWVGGLVGVSSEHYKLRRFRFDIQQGSYLIMVDIQPSQRAIVQDTVAQFPMIHRAGEDSTLINPFARPAF